MNRWLVNGEVDARVPVTDRGLGYGDGLFETIAIRRGQPRFLERHLDRLLEGARRLGITPPDAALLHDEVTSSSQGCEFGTVKILLTRGSGPRGYAPPVKQVPTRIVGCQPAEPAPRDHYSAGVIVRHCQTTISEQPRTAGLKTLNRLEQVLARAEWSDARISEGLMSTLDGRVICGTMSNVFVITDGKLLMPELATCGVEGVMKHVLLEAADALGIESQATRLDAAAIAAADEVFVTNSLIGLWPVRELEDRNWQPGPVTLRLMQALAESGVEECEPDA